MASEAPKQRLRGWNRRRVLAVVVALAIVLAVAGVFVAHSTGGKKQELTDIWMVHDWIVPGWECSWGVFAAECPELGGKTGLDAWHT